MSMPGLIDRIREFRIVVYAMIGVTPSLSVARMYVEQHAWFSGDDVDMAKLSDVETQRVAEQRAVDHAKRSYEFLKHITKQSHQDAHGRVVIPHPLWIQIMDHINMLEAK